MWRSAAILESAGRRPSTGATSANAGKDKILTSIQIGQSEDATASHKMARKSQRLSEASKASPAHKRAASKSAISTANSKRPKKGGNAKETPTKSQYFEHEDENDDEQLSEPSSAEEEASEFDEEDADSPPSDPDDGDEDDSEDENPKRSSKSTPQKGGTTSAAIRSKGHELWRPGVKTGLGPGTQVVIKKPKARPAGKTPYEDETIHPNTLLFLADLKANNDRQWLKSKCMTFILLLPFPAISM